MSRLASTPPCMAWRAAVACLVLLAFLALGAVPARGDRAEALRGELEQRKRKILAQAAQTHLEVGVWCRDAGLVPQATAEFLRAVEVAEGRNPGAVKLVAIMRRLDDKFWKRRLEDPSPGMLRAYDKRARKARADWIRARMGLAAWAAKKKDLTEEALAEYRALAAAIDRPLELDARGRVVLEGAAVPEEISARLVQESVTINERRYVRDDFLALLPDMESIHEAASEDVRVRTQRGPEEAASLLAICEALLPHLEKDLGGRPTKRMSVFVFATRAGYESYLDAADLSDHKVATGIADGGRFTAMICAEGLDEDTVHAVTLHELSHLFQYGVTPVVMPSWQAEGFAETWGGPGTFTWDGKVLVPGGMLASHRLAPLQEEDGLIPLEELLASDALVLLSGDRAKGHRFYAQSWAFLRWLRTAAPADVRERYRRWDAMCKGAALGAVPGQPYQHNRAPAADLFRTVVATDVPALEAAFRTWLAGL